MPTLVLLRHGESDWNRENRFTGWTDVDLSATGVAEAHEAARLLAAEGLTFDIAYTSLLKRAIRTLWIVLDDLDLMWLPVRGSWRLNERHYGALQGLDKAETARSTATSRSACGGAATTSRRRRSTRRDERFPGRDRRYADLADADLPRAESLKDTVARFLPYWHEEIAPAVAAGQARAHRGPRQQPAGPREVPRRRLGRGDRRAQHPDRRAARLRARRRRSGRRATATSATRRGIEAAMAAVAAQGTAGRR